MNSVVAAVITLVLGAAVAFAVRGHPGTDIDADSPGMGHSMSSTNSSVKKPERITRPSDIEKAKEADYVSKLLAERNELSEQLEMNHAHGNMNHGAMGNAAGQGDQSAAAHEAMHDQKVDVSGQTNPPDLELSVSRDSHGGWNLKLRTSNFRFSPENVGGEHVDGEGHAHLYVNGKKIARLYGENFHIASLASGSNVVQVSLNTNDHQTYALGDEPVQRTVTINEN